jgi:hypothetical protein
VTTSALTATGVVTLGDDAIQANEIQDGAVTSSKILDGTIVDADVSSTAAIQGTKISPDFGAQAVQTTGTLAAGTTTVTGNIIVTGTVDGRDVSADGATLDAIDATGISSLTAAEVAQLSNIDLTTISTTQWGYLGSMDQGVSTGDDVTFNEISDGTATITGGALTGATSIGTGTITATGAVTGGTLTDGTLSITTGAVSGATSIGTGSLTASGVVTGGTLTDGTLSITGGNLTTTGTLNVGAATATTINNVTITPPATGSTLTIQDGQTLTVSGSATISGGTHSGINTGDQTLSGLGGVPDTRTVNGKALSSDITLLLASSDFVGQGALNTVLHGGGAGNPSWSQIVNADIDAAAGIVDTKLATISTAGKVSNSATTATNDNTVNAIVARDASGNFTAGTITAALNGNAATATLASTVTTNANLTGPITSVGNATSVASQTGTGSTFVMNDTPTLITPNIGAATGTSLTATGALSGNQLTSTVADGTAPLVVTSTTPVANLSIGGNAATATTAASAGSFTGALAGDVTGNQGATVVSMVDGTTAANVATGAGLANAATNANTASAIVRRDASGNFTAGTITAALNGNAATATLASTATHLAGGDQASIPYQTGAGATTFLPKGTAGQVLTINPAATAIQWKNPSETWLTLADAQTVTGLKTFNDSRLAMKGTSTGITTISSANASATDYIIILPAANGTVALANTPITGGTNTKITYDSKGLVTSGTDATTADIAPSANRNYVNDAQLTVIENTTGTNSGNVTLNAIGSVPNANGASIAGQVLTLQPADATNGGVVTTVAQTFAGVKTFNDAVSFKNNFTIDGTGSTTATPRTIGINPWGLDNAARYTFGDDWNALQNAYNNRLQITAYHGIEIVGNRRTASGLSFVNGAATDPALSVIGTTTTAPVLSVLAPTGQSGNLQEWKVNNITLASINQTGKISTSGGATINGAFNWGGTSGGTNNAKTVSLSPAPTAYTAGMMVVFKAGSNNTGACTIDVNSIGAKSILTPTGGALASGDITSGGVYIVVYDGTNFYLIR